MCVASGVAPRPRTCGVEADGNVDLVFAGEEEEGVALAAELIVLLDGVHLVDLGLDLRCGSRGEKISTLGPKSGALGLLAACAAVVAEEEGDQGL